MRLSAVDLGGDLSIKILVERYGVKPPVSWEDPLEMDRSGKRVLLYSFGAVVGVDMSASEVLKVAEEFVNFVEGGRIGEAEEIDIHRDLGMKIESDDEILVVSFALAQSVSLSRMEGKMDQIEEEVEAVISRKRGGRKALSVAKELMKVRHELISDIMILERPSSTWEHEKLEDVYEKVAKYLELGRRYRVLEKRLDSSFESVQVLLSIHAEARETFLEFLIVLLIIVEIFLWIMEMV